VLSLIKLKYDTMDPDGVIMYNSSSLDGFTKDPPSGDAFIYSGPSSLYDFCYSSEDVAYLQSIEREAALLFPYGKVYNSPSELREAVRSFAYQKGFEITTSGNKILCSRCDEPTSHKNKREKKIASGVVPVEKRRTYKSSTRCGCPFKISYSRMLSSSSLSSSSVAVSSRESSKVLVRITGSCIYKHDQGCRPSSSQLVVETRKGGSHTRSVKASQMKTILTLLKTGEKVPPKLLRKLLRPLFPPEQTVTETDDTAAEEETEKKEESSGGIYGLTRELAGLVDKIQDQTKKERYYEAIVHMVETLKGNGEWVGPESLSIGEFIRE
jgi:hypothetical protein